MTTMQNPTVVLTGDGTVEIRDRALPELLPRQALVRMAAGAVSTGTETTMIRQLRESPRDIADPWRLGYAGAGVVEAVGEGYSGPPVGSRVACYGGPYVGHSAVVAVSQNLVAPFARVSAEEAAFGGIGAVAMHAIRNGKVTLGERVGVMGLGVLGQFVAQLARAAGAWVIASDPLASRREMARDLGADVLTSPDEWDEAVKDFTDGTGLDCVQVVAGTPASNGPAVQGLSAVRFQGRVVIVGNVRTEWEREVLFQKEATVMVSRAAGPGRYDPDFERESHPWPGVRWTEGENLRSFTEMVDAGRVRVAPLISGVLPVTDAAKAYDRLMNAPDETMALVLRFN